jgi:hypothetical protein
MMPRILLITISAVIAFGPASVRAGNVPLKKEPDNKGPVFSTWDDFEADKCASIWLITRFIDRNAVIKLFPKGEIIKEGIPFDTPEATLRRYHNMATFEAILREYYLTDPVLSYMGKIIHDIEVNTWQRKIYKETLTVQQDVQTIIRNAKNSEEVIGRTKEYFDSLYKRLKGEQEGTPRKSLNSPTPPAD